MYSNVLENKCPSRVESALGARSWHHFEMYKAVDCRCDTTQISLLFGSNMKASLASLPQFAAHYALYPRSYTVKRVPTGEQIPIDGCIDHDIWQDVPWSEPFGDITGQIDDSIPPTRFKALYDDLYLYIATDSPPQTNLSTEAHYTIRNSPIFHTDSDMEVFTDIGQHNTHYKELELNAINTVWNLLLNKPYRDGGHEHSGRIAQPGEELYYDVDEQQTATRVVSGSLNQEKNGAHWTTTLALAWKDLQVTAGGGGFELDVPPKSLRINFSRVEKKGNINWTWQPQVKWDPVPKTFHGFVDMHLPDAWGYFVLDQDDWKDPLWPVKLAAHCIYYALHAYKDAHGEYTEDMSRLSLPDDIVAPFEVSISSQGDGFQAVVFCAVNKLWATIRNDRLITFDSQAPFAK